TTPLIVPTAINSGPSHLRSALAPIPARRKLSGLFLDPGKDAILRCAVRESTQLLDARGAGDVDLDEPPSDEVQADEPQAVLAQGRGDVRHQVALGVRQLRGFDAAADVDVRSKVVAPGDAQDDAQRLAVEHEHALVSLANGRLVLLNQSLVPSFVGE